MKKTFSIHIKNSLIDFKYAKGASDRDGKEFHNFHEIIYLMGGDVEFISDNIHTSLTPECVVVIPKNSYHQFIIHGDQNQYHRCMFNFFDIDGLQALISQNLNKVHIYSPTNLQKNLFKKMIDLTNSKFEDATKHVITQAVLTLLLTEISANETISNTNNLSATTLDAIGLINQSLCKNISLTDIARRLNVSVSGLSHIFKDEMNISIYKYILKKRLSLAHERLLLGEPSTKVAEECGFGDYSGFYKIFKKEFGISPSQVDLPS